MNIEKGILTVLLFLGYVILWYIKRRELLRIEGVDVNVIYKAEKPVQRYFGFLGRTMTAAVVFIITAHLFFYGEYLMITPLININNFILNLTGFITGLSGLLLCRVAQVTIGRSWRVGIDESARPGLITNGIYRFIRNPTYTGLYLLCAGVWIINPTSLFLFWISAFVLMMEFQVRCEEEYLEEQYGMVYLEYFKQSKRYIPFLV